MIITGKKFSKPEMSRVINGDIDLKSQEEKPEKFRLDHLLVEQYPSYNRSSLQTFIKNGYVTVDGKVAKKPNEKYEKSAKLHLDIPAIGLPEDFVPPEIIFEDKNVRVVNKPAGLLSMVKGEYSLEPTLENYGLLVHRLDRDTSGVVILAKNPETQRLLRRQFQDRKVHKTYLAIVEGHPRLPEAKIELPIARNLKHPTTFQVDPNGKPAETYYRVLKSNDKYSLLELKPITGRTHQLRVHLKYIGTPILGDRVYGKSPASRLFLHAQSLEITIPVSDRRTFEAPVPPEFDDVLS
ncbi:RluA family pseudouridine synthase [Candidatus Saccharibacteria bacterium]|nr:RluA family pseudouridine synthase [Candidatus Saccharibacteria bacterium]